MAGFSTTAPRPLHLASGSFIASLNSPGESLPSSQFDIPTSVGNFNPVPIGTNGTNCKHGTAMVQPQTPVTAMKHQLAHKSRRHSSISYIHSDSNSSLLFQRESMDGLLRSPLSGPHTVTAFDVRQVAQKSSSSASVKFQFGSSRSSSVCGVGKNEAYSLRSPVFNRWNTEFDLSDSNTTESIKPLKERPVTLAEKHSELLHFIAQKEAKCLELRSQLATHEAELLQLKRRWERIVNRGLEKSHTLSSPTPSCQPSFPSPPPSAGGQVSSPQPTSPQSAPPYFPLLPPVVNAHAPVLEGIKEGVQGVGRLIAAGLESFAGGPVGVSPSSPAAALSPLPPAGPGSSSKLGRRALKLGHGQNESQSSSSSTSASAFSTFSTSTHTSVTSIASSWFLEEQTTSPPVESTLLSVGESEHQGEGSVIEGSTSDCSEQVLFVRDTGATPTMSPNPEFEQKRRARQRNEKRGGSLTGSPVRKSSKVQRDSIPLPEHGWPNWDELYSTSHTERSRSSDEIGGSKPITSTTTSSSKVSIYTDAVDVISPIAPQQSSWMDSVGKKWGEIRGSSASTFVKNQTRASLLLSDMQNSFVTALTSPTPFAPSPSDSASKSSEKRPPSPSFSSNTSLASTSQYHSKSAKLVTPSLLDTSDTECGEAEVPGTEGHSESVKICLKTPTLVPSVRPIARLVALRNTACLDKGREMMKEGQTLEDEWNW